VFDITTLDPTKPVLIAGPTASGKSGLALDIARTQGGVIVNADALQVFSGWRILTARPSVHDEDLAPHKLYGHIPFDGSYSVGDWLRDVAPLLTGPDRPIIVGGTGLYLTALTEGLADIPATPAAIRAAGDALPLHTLLAALDDDTRDRLDQRNRMRVQRAWEVQETTGRSLAQWQQTATAPLLPLDQAQAFVIDAPKDWLTPRIEHRFDQMLAQGALAEADQMRANWTPAHQSSRAIGASDLIAHLKGELSLDDARQAAIIATRQYAKRQRTWFRARMGKWTVIHRQSTA
jgi:tRNA dimethylallyltransferase